MFSMLALAAMSPAHAFCGAFFGSAGSDLFNDSSQVVAARYGDTTTLTLANSYEGSLMDFAMVIPVPVVLDEDDVRVVDDGLMDEVDAYSQPRLVTYTCEQLHPELYWEDYDYNSSGRCGCFFQQCDYAVMADSAGEYGSDGGTASSVVVEKEFAVGEYEIVILSAEDSGDLILWLNQEGYSMSIDAEDVVDEYIEAGSYFFAARVSLEGLPGAETYLSPLQFSYNSDIFSLPIRLGTINSRGDQDTIVYVINHMEDGQAAISNYPQVELDDECMLDLDTDEEFGPTYAEAFSDAHADIDAGWTLEYSWGPYHCDPCVTEPLPDQTLSALGYPRSGQEAWFTRLHMRYTAQAALEDIVFYESGITEQSQVRFVKYAPELESDFPLCDGGWVTDDPGACVAEDDTTARVSRSWLGWSTALMLAGLPLLAGLVRRKRY